MAEDQYKSVSYALKTISFHEPFLFRK